MNGVDSSVTKFGLFAWVGSWLLLPDCCDPLIGWPHQLLRAAVRDVDWRFTVWVLAVAVVVDLVSNEHRPPTLIAELAKPYDDATRQTVVTPLPPAPRLPSRVRLEGPVWFRVVL